jgi:hypothetical protein
MAGVSRHLVQLILPLYDPDGHAFGGKAFAKVRAELTDVFGGTTAYTRAPAEGTWEDPSGRVHHDEVIVVEVMTDALDREWWGRYSAELAERFRQDAIVIRAIPIETIGVLPAPHKRSG